MLFTVKQHAYYNFFLIKLIHPNYLFIPSLILLKYSTICSLMLQFRCLMGDINSLNLIGHLRRLNEMTDGKCTESYWYRVVYILLNVIFFKSIYLFLHLYLFRESPGKLTLGYFCLRRF